MKFVHYPHHLPASAIERHIGARLRALRLEQGLSQEGLACLIGVSHQQANKYERGLNRIASSRLYEIATKLGVEVGAFFEGLDIEPNGAQPGPGNRQFIDLARHFRKISTAAHRTLLIHVAAAFAGIPGGTAEGGMTPDEPVGAV